MPGRDPHAGRRRHPRRPLPLAVARGAVHPHAGPQGRRAVEPVRRQGPAARVACARTIRCSSWSPSASTARPRARCPRATTRSPLGKAQGRRARARRCTRARVERHGVRSPRRPPRRPPRPASRSRSIDLRTLLPLDIETILASREEDRPLRDRARGAAHLRLRRRADRVDPGARDRVPRGADPARHRLRHAVPVHARARVPAQRRSRRWRAIRQTLEW